MSRKLCLALALMIAAGTVPGAVEAAELGYRTWGPRVGFSDSPDQIVGGVHLDLGEFHRRVRLQPSFDIGFGDDTTSLSANFMVAYYFEIDGKLTPYAGGQVSVFFFDHDNSGSDTEIGPSVVGGFETPISRGNRFLVELQIGVNNDIPDAKLMVGWIF